MTKKKVTAKVLSQKKIGPDIYDLWMSTELAETARPGERTAAYYASRPCERCIAFCARRAADLEAKARRHENTRPPLQGNRAL